MIYLALIGFGLFSLVGLPMNQLPEVDLPVIAVVTTYEGASSEDVETLVTEPIERAVASVENVEGVRSESREGTSLVVVSFTWGTDMDAAEVDVRKNLELFADDFLPDDIGRSLTFALDPSLAPVFFMALEGPLDGHELRRLAIERVQPRFGRLEGVAAAEVIGGLERQIQVRLEPAWVEALGLTPESIADALRAANVLVPTGTVEDGAQSLALQPTGQLRTVDEIRDVVVGQRGGRPIPLAEVATVVDGFEDETHVVTANGTRAVLVAVRKQSAANTVQVARNVRAALPGIQERLPDGVRLDPLFDESEAILRAIGNLGLTAVQAFLLTGLVLLVFLRSWRTSLIAVVAVPTSIVVAFVAMDALGVTLNLISMAGLALAVGMLVDNGIVVLEAAFQEVEKGASATEAAVRGAREMSLPLFASTLTTVVVFVPILLVQGIAGELFRDLVLTITVTLLSSLVVALTLVPLMASRLVGRDQRSRFAAALRARTGFLDRLAPTYESALGWALRRRKRVLGGAALTFALALGLVPLLGQDFLPKADTSEIRMQVAAPPGISLDGMRGVIAEVEAAVDDVVPEAEVLVTDYGVPEGFAAVFGGATNEGTLRLKLPPISARDRSQQEIEAALSDRFDDIPGVDVRIQSFALGGSGGDIQVKLFGDDLGVLRTFGRELRDALGAVEGVRETRFSMQTGSPELELRLDRDRLRVLGLTPAEVTATLRGWYRGVAATVYREDGDEFLVNVRAPKEVRSDIDRLRYVPVRLPGGGSVPLGSVAELGNRLGPTTIEHEDQQRLATVEITAQGLDLGGLVSRVEQRIAEVGQPEGVRIELGGTAEDLRDAFFKLALALAAALALVYMVMASQFESLLEPFVIMFTVPLAIIGVVLGLAATGTTLQVTALVGVILLGGVVVNNGIVLVDVLKRRRAEGMDLEDACLEAARTRVRPILMTALTTILGMLPLSLGFGDGAEIWAPMARAVIGGMIVATALTLFVVPCLYVLVASRRRRRDDPGDAEAAGEGTEARLSRAA